MEKSVYLLYECDQWLSRDSMVLMGIFSTKEKLLKNAKKLARERGKEHLRHAKDNDRGYTTQRECIDEIMFDLEGCGQTQTWETNYYTVCVPLDVLEEI